MKKELKLIKEIFGVVIMFIQFLKEIEKDYREQKPRNKCQNRIWKDRTCLVKGRGTLEESKKIECVSIKH